MLDSQRLTRFENLEYETKKSAMFSLRRWLTAASKATSGAYPSRYTRTHLNHKKHNDVDATLKICRNNGVVFLVVLVINLQRRIYDVV